FFIIVVQTPGSGISILLAVGTPSTGSGNLYCQWELSPGSGNALCILFPTMSASVALSREKSCVVISADFAVTYTAVHSEARSWSILSEDPYEEAPQQLLEQAPRSPDRYHHRLLPPIPLLLPPTTAPLHHSRYHHRLLPPIPLLLPHHVPSHIPEHPEDLVLAEDEAPIEAYIPKVASVPTPPLPPSFLSPRTPPLLPIPLPVPSTSHRAEIPEADTPPQKRLLLTTPRPQCKVGESSPAAAARQPGLTMAHSVDCSFVDTIETTF
nr:hypothetical protein [Tanacetum cinerariifolium]